MINPLYNNLESQIAANGKLIDTVKGRAIHLEVHLVGALSTERFLDITRTFLSSYHVST